MQVVTSMYLQTSTSRCVPRPGTVPGWAEICWICRTLSSLTSRPFPSSLLDLHEEALELRRVGVRVNRRRLKLVRGVERRLALVLLDAAVAPVNRDADLVSLLAVNHHRPDAPGDHRLGDVDAARARDFHFLAAGDAHLVGELPRDFDGGFGDELDVHRVVLRPVVVVLGQTVGGADDVEALVGRTQLVAGWRTYPSWG